MLSFSDYSGSGFEKDFQFYISGYPLPSSKFMFLRKLGYADEMQRPGLRLDSFFINRFY
jgi:hypothetical protein